MISLPNQTEESALQDVLPDLTPMLDILFTLLVFFMLTVGATYQTLHVDIPESQSAMQFLPAQSTTLTLQIAASSYHLNDESFENLDNLKQALLSYQHNHPQNEVLIASDRNIPVQRLIHILTLLQDLQIPTANILMQEEQS